MRSLLGSSLGMGLVLLAFWALAPHGYWLLPVAFATTFLGSVLVVNLQLRLMDVAGEAQTLGAAMNHASLNVANALGAWLGGRSSPPATATGPRRWSAWGSRSPASRWCRVSGPRAATSEADRVRVTVRPTP